MLSGSTKEILHGFDLERKQNFNKPFLSVSFPQIDFSTMCFSSVSVNCMKL